jgi:predicted phage tail component-like protein
MTTASLDGVALSTIPEVELLRVRRPFPTPRHRSVAIPGRAGSIIFPEEPGDRTVILDVHVAADSFGDRRSAVEALIGWCYLGRVAELIVDDQSDRYEEAILDGVVDPDEWLLSGRAAIPFRCGAYALATATTTEGLVAATNPDSDSFSVPDNVDARPIIEITPSGGDVTAFVLTVNGFALNWEGTLLSGETLTVSTLSETITEGVSTDVNLTGAYDPDGVRMTDAFGFFPLLIPGSNAWSFSWTGTATSVALDLEWRERFLT